MNELTYIVLVLALWNIVTFALYGVDKRKARKNKWRISETTLITCAFLMGGAGALLGMSVFHHKTKRLKFKLLVPLAAIVNTGIIVCYIYFRQILCGGVGRMTVRFTDDEIKLMQKALDQWGLNAQAGQTIEECAELIVALQKHINRTPSPGTIDAVVDEITDVEMMLAQMRLAFGIDDDTFRKRIENKFTRLRQYLEDDKV